MLEYSAMPAPRRWHFDMAQAQFGERIDVAWITAPTPWISVCGISLCENAEHVAPDGCRLAAERALATMPCIVPTSEVWSPIACDGWRMRGSSTIESSSTWRNSARRSWGL